MVSTAGGGVVAPVPAADGLVPGQKAGPWVVERELGRGGMGAVYAVTHDTIGKRAALKVVHNRLLTPSFNPERMLLEARVVNQVGHPNIVDIFETGKLPDGRPYIVMERLDGQPLSDRADDGKILPDQVIGILLQVCDALLAAHTANVIHRDLKLDNVFLVDNPDDPHAPKVKLLDWGIAKVINQEVRHTVEGQLVGTPQYLAPEQARGGQVSPATDVYSLGVMAYELFLEQLPFEAETSAEIMAMHLRVPPPPPSELWPEIPQKLEALLLQMLAKAPDERPSVLDVAHRLEQIRDELLQRRDDIAQTRASGVAKTAVPVEPVAASKISVAKSVVASSKVLRPSLSKLLAPVGFAPTEQVEVAPRQKRWQFAAGGFAVVASVMMILLSRDGNTQSASAESSVPPAPAELAPPAPAIVEPSPIVADAVDEPTTVEVAPAATAPTTIKATRTAPRASSSIQRTPRKPAVLPRRAAKVDLDGTLDPYR